MDEHGEPVYPPHALVRLVNRVGVIGYQRKAITVGNRWRGARLRVIPTGDLLHIYYGEELVRVLSIDPTRTYQPSGKGVSRAKAVT